MSLTTTGTIGIIIPLQLIMLIKLIIHGWECEPILKGVQLKMKAVGCWAEAVHKSGQFRLEVQPGIGTALGMHREQELAGRGLGHRQERLGRRAGRDLGSQEQPHFLE